MQYPEQSGAADAAGAVARIVHASQATVTQSIYTEMERIRASALRHNAPAGVSTALLYESGWFIQWKEGPGAALQPVFAHWQATAQGGGLPARLWPAAAQ